MDNEFSSILNLYETEFFDKMTETLILNPHCSALVFFT